MSGQPTPLALADILQHKLPSIECLGVAAAELRRLHQSNTELLAALDHIEKTLTRQLELIADRAPGDYLDKRPVVQSLQSHARRARAAIAKATGGAV